MWGCAIAQALRRNRCLGCGECDSEALLQASSLLGDVGRTIAFWGVGVRSLFWECGDAIAKRSVGIAVWGCGGAIA